METLRCAAGIVALMVALAAPAFGEAEPFDINGSFDNDELSPWVVFGAPGQRAEAVIIDGGTTEGGKALRISNGGGFSTGVQCNLPIEPGEQPLWVSAKVHRSQVAPSRGYDFGISFNVRYTDDEGKWETSPHGFFDPAKTGWQEVQFIWTPARAIKSAQVRVMTGDGEPTLIDDVVVRYATDAEVAAWTTKLEAARPAPTPAPKPQPAAAAPQLLRETPNYGFESEPLTYWGPMGQKKPNVVIDDQIAFAGKRSLRADFDEPSFAGVECAPVWFEQSFPTALLIEASVRRPKASTANRAYTFGVSFNARYMDGQDKWETPREGMFDPGVTEWQTVSFFWMPTKPIERVGLRIMNAEGGSMWVDNVRVLALTEDLLKRTDIELGDIRPVNQVESFDAALPDWLIAHRGTWAVSDGVLTTSGQEPPGGWFIRSPYHYRHDNLSFRVRKENPDGIVYLHTRHWRFLFRPNEVMVKSVRSPDWWFSCARDIAFNDTAWHSFEVAFTGEGLKMTWDGKALATWVSPYDEWQGKPYDHCLHDKQLSFREVDEILVLQSRLGGAAFDDLSLKGVQTGKAEGFVESLRYPEHFVRDDQFDRLAPLEPVDVTWDAPTDGRPDEMPPAVSEWRITEYLESRQPKGVHFIDYTIGGANEQGFPEGVRHPRYDAPVEVSIHFNLEKAGIYTLKIPITECKNLANVLEVEVDRQVVSREVYRAFNHSSALPGEGLKDYIPLKLKAGYHVITLRLSTVLLDKFDNAPSMPPDPRNNWEYMRGWYWKFGRVLWSGHQPVELTPGFERPRWTFSAKQPQDEAAFAAANEDTDMFGKELVLDITDLPDGEATLTLGFNEITLDGPNQRLMDIKANGALIAEGFDIAKEAGCDLVYVERTFPVTLRDGKLTLEVIGRKFQASLSYMAIKQGDKLLYERNVGWTPQFNNWGFHARYDTNNLDATPAIHCDPRKNNLDVNYYEGHNLACNPSFSFTENDGRPVGWRDIAELVERSKTTAFHASKGDYQINELAGTGSYAVDMNTCRTPGGSLRVDKTQGVYGITTVFTPIVYTKQQSFSAWIKANGATGKARVALFFYAQDYFDLALANLPLRMLGKAESSDYVTGTGDWQKVTVTAQPPFGTALAAMALVVEDNTEGSVWFDDVHMDAYGSYPLEITRSQLGFHPNGNKRLLVKAMAGDPVAFTIADASGATVKRGMAQPLGYHQYPDRFYFLVDAADITAPGDYRLEVTQMDLTRGETFTINAGVYDGLTKLLLMAIDAKRMNVEVPGYHEATHLEDATIWELVYPRFDKMVKVHSRTMNALGGFHDAGDRIKHWDLAPALIFGSMMTEDVFATRDAPLSDWGKRLAIWGIDSQITAMHGDGSFYYADKPYHYDGIPMFGIERYIRGRIKGPQTSGIFAKAAIALRQSDPQRSERYAEAAVRVYRAAKATYDTLSFHRRDIGFNLLRLHTKQLYGATYLYKLTGDERYADDLAHHAAGYCRAINERAYLEPGYRAYDEHGGSVPGNVLSMEILWSPTFFLAEYPDHPQAPAVKHALMTLIGDMQRVASIEPWDQLMDLEKPSMEPARWPTGRPLGYWTMSALGLARAGMVLDRPDLVLFGERQLQWALGHNPYDVAMAHGVGEAFVGGGDMFFLEPEFQRRHIADGRKLWYYDGCVPTMAFRLSKNAGGVSYAKSDSNWGPIAGAPIGHVPLYIQGDYPIHPGPTEYHQSLSGNFCAAAAVMSDAMNWLAHRKAQ